MGRCRKNETGCRKKWFTTVQSGVREKAPFGGNQVQQPGVGKKAPLGAHQVQQPGVGNRENQSSINFKYIPRLNSAVQILPKQNMVDIYLIWALKCLIYTLFELKKFGFLWQEKNLVQEKRPPLGANQVQQPVIGKKAGPIKFRKEVEVIGLNDPPPPIVSPPQGG